MRDKVLGYGIDFGTTNSLISVAYPDRVEVVPIATTGGGELAYCMPTVVYFDRNDDHRAGEDAIEQYVYIGANETQCNYCDVGCDPLLTDLPRRRGERASYRTSCMDARLAYGLKATIADMGYSGTESWGQHFNIEEMVSWVLNALRKVVDDGRREIKVPTMIGVPVEYDGEKTGSRELALDRMLAGARAAGFANIEFLEEPKAALVADIASGVDARPNGAYIAVDFGGGTFDVAVSTGGATPWAVDTIKGVPVGGERFDSLLFTEIVAPKLGIMDILDQCEWLQERSSMIMAVGRSEFRAELGMATGPGARMFTHIFNRGQVYAFWRAIEEAKVALSSQQETRVDFHRPGVQIDVPVSREEFEHVIKPDLNRVRRTITKVLDSARVDASRVVLVIKTGGSSALPAFNEMLRDLFPNAVFEDKPALTTIVQGLGHYVRFKLGENFESKSMQTPKVLANEVGGRSTASVRVADDKQQGSQATNLPTLPPLREGLLAKLKRLLGWK